MNNIQCPGQNESVAKAALSTLSVTLRSTNEYFVWWRRVMARTVTAATVFRVHCSVNAVKLRGPTALGV